MPSPNGSCRLSGNTIHITRADNLVTHESGIRRPSLISDKGKNI
jgi:hypothetical protein